MTWCVQSGGLVGAFRQPEEGGRWRALASVRRRTARTCQCHPFTFVPSARSLTIQRWSPSPIFAMVLPVPSSVPLSSVFCAGSFKPHMKPHERSRVCCVRRGRRTRVTERKARKRVRVSQFVIAIAFASCGVYAFWFVYSKALH